ncbi:MAG: hypothetical protein GY950_33935, partial [bacterium]|nr:hypothetical protein [bacterium]
MKYLQEELRKKLIEFLKDEFSLEPGEIQFSIPPKRDFGDLSTTIPFILAKKEKQKPFLIGKKIIEIIENKFDMFSDIKLAGGGFLNFTFKKNFLLNYLSENINRKPVPQLDKMVV